MGTTRLPVITVGWVSAARASTSRKDPAPLHLVERRRAVGVGEGRERARGLLRGRAQRRLLSQAARHDLGEGAGDRRLELARVGRVDEHVVQEHASRRGVAEGVLAGEQEKQDDADAVDVGAIGHLGGALNLLGRHERGGAQDRALDRPRVAGERVLVELGDAEVEELQAGRVLREHHVPRLHVAVDDAPRVGGGERLAQDGGEPRHRPGLPAMAGARALLKGHAVDELLHLEEQAVVGDVDVKHAHHRRVGDRRRARRLAQEAMQGVELLRRAGLHDLDGHALAGGPVETGVHRAHAALADGALHLEAIAEDRPLLEDAVHVTLLRELRQGHGELRGPRANLRRELGVQPRDLVRALDRLRHLLGDADLQAGVELGEGLALFVDGDPLHEVSPARGVEEESEADAHRGHRGAVGEHGQP